MLDTSKGSGWPRLNSARNTGRWDLRHENPHPTGNIPGNIPSKISARGNSLKNFGQGIFPQKFRPGAASAALGPKKGKPLKALYPQLNALCLELLPTKVPYLTHRLGLQKSPSNHQRSHETSSNLEVRFPPMSGLTHGYSSFGGLTK